MASLDMDGPFEFSAQQIKEAVAKPLPGNFALGHSDGKQFAVQFVGRHDQNVREGLMEALKGDIGKPGLFERLFKSKPKIDKFKFSYAANGAAAYEKQCRNYHGFGEAKALSNARHPKPPRGQKLKCSICGK